MVANQRQATPAMAAVQAAPAPRSTRMALANVRKGKLIEPARVLMYGTEGVGKSTFAAGAPNPIFICAESGTHHLDVARFPVPERWEDVLEAVDVLTREQHDYGTLAIDTLDWIEPLVWDYVVRHSPPDKMGKRPASIEEVGGGFGKGYTAAVDQWRILVDRMEKLQASKRMHVVLVAHAWIKAFANPEGENYDRYELKLQKLASGKLKEWVDAVLFATFDSGTHKESRNEKAKGVADGSRIVRTERRAAFDAKNRHGLPFRMPLSWDEFWAGVESGQPASPQKMIAEARNLGVVAGVEDKVEAAIIRAKGDATKLAQLLDWVRGKVQLAEPTDGSTGAETQETPAA